MANQSFSHILDKPSNQAERPKPLPEGTYLCTVAGMPRYDKSSKKQTDFVEFTLNVVQAGDDVDQEMLAQMGGIAGKTIKDTYYITEAAEYRLREFLDNLGIADKDDNADDLSHRQRIEQAPGCSVLVSIKHTASDDGRSIYANVAGTAAAE